MPDERLLCAASLVRQGSRVADIGTDHAYLPIYLVESGRCVSAIASDIRVGPADSARKNVTTAGLCDRIEVRLGDGLSGITPDEVDDIVIAGMGGETIAAILQGAEWVKDAHYRLILQPMTRAEDLRRYLLTNGFEIDEERVVPDGRRLYTVMAVRFTGAGPVTDEVAYYRGKLPPEGMALLKKDITRLQKKADGCRTAGKEDEAAIYTALIDRLEASL